MWTCRVMLCRSNGVLERFEGERVANKLERKSNSRLVELGAELERHSRDGDITMPPETYSNDFGGFWN